MMKFTAEKLWPNMKLRVIGKHSYSENELILMNVFSFYCVKVLDLQSIKIKIDICDFDDSLKGAVFDSEEKYLVCVKKGMTIENIMQTIAHELTHVGQFVYDDLSKDICSSFDYQTCWWEVEARENSIYLFNEFKSKYSMSIFKMGLRNFQNFIINNKGKM